MSELMYNEWRRLRLQLAEYIILRTLNTWCQNYDGAIAYRNLVKDYEKMIKNIEKKCQ